MNLGEIRSELQALGYGPDTEDEQTILINAVYRDVTGERRWPWLQRTVDILIDRDTSQVDLAFSAPDAREIDAVYVVGHSSPAFVPYGDFVALTAARPAAHGVPTAWSLSRPWLLELHPTPDRAYRLRVAYIAIVTPLRNDFDVPVIPEQHHDVLVYGAAAKMGIRERDTDQSQLMSAAYERALARLRAASNVVQRQNSEQVRQTGLYRHGDGSCWWGC